MASEPGPAAVAPRSHARRGARWSRRAAPMMAPALQLKGRTPGARDLQGRAFMHHRPPSHRGRARVRAFLLPACALGASCGWARPGPTGAVISGPGRTGPGTGAQPRARPGAWVPGRVGCTAFPCLDRGAPSPKRSPCADPGTAPRPATACAGPSPETRCRAICSWDGWSPQPAGGGTCGGDGGLQPAAHRPSHLRTSEYRTRTGGCISPSVVARQEGGAVCTVATCRERSLGNDRTPDNGAKLEASAQDHEEAT